MKRILKIAAVAIVALACTGILSAQSDPFIGVWKLNVAKSDYTATQAPKSETRTIEAQGKGVKHTLEGTAADGSRIAYSYTSNLDGKDSPISGVGQPSGGATIAVKRVNAHTTTAITRRPDKSVLTTSIAVVSKDGKVMTNTVKGTNAKGQSGAFTSVWDKQ